MEEIKIARLFQTMIYTVKNGPMPTTAAFAKVSVSTIKTMLQLKTLVPCRIVEWGCSFDGFAAALPGQVELIDTGASVFATVTASAAVDIDQCDGEARQFGDPTSNYISIGTTATGYTASGEGTVASVVHLDSPQLIAPTNQYIKQFPLGQEPYVVAAHSIRIRMTFGTSVGAYCYVRLAF
jgi:hypothetical protein